MRLVALLAACVLLLQAGAASAATPSLVSILLRPAQVGQGYAAYRRSDGSGLRQRTLDLCGVKNYPSEQLRSGRIQVDYLRRGSAIGISNEVVSYKPGGAAQALREVTRHAVTCPHRKIDPGEQNLPPLRFTMTLLKDPRLLKGYLAVRVRVVGTVKGKHVDQISYAVYQRRGNVLSGVYSFGPDTAAQRQICLHAAEQSARNLRGAHSGPSGPTA